MKSHLKTTLIICLVSIISIFSKVITKEVTEIYSNTVSAISSKVQIQVPF